MHLHLLHASSILAISLHGELIYTGISHSLDVQYHRVWEISMPLIYIYIYRERESQQVMHKITAQLALEYININMHICKCIPVSYY